MPNVYSQVLLDQFKTEPQELPTHGGRIIHAEEGLSHFLYQRHPFIILYFEVSQKVFEKKDNVNRKFVAVLNGNTGPDGYEQVASLRTQEGRLVHILQEIDYVKKAFGF